MDLARKYRPKSFSEFYGNEDVVHLLKGQLKKNDLPHLCMFHGPSGCGKTTLARLIADKLGCDRIDFKEYNGANTNGIDTIRTLPGLISSCPMKHDGVKVLLFDECHMLTAQAQEAALKIFEELPDHCYIFLCTTLPDKMIKAVRNRAAMYEVRTLTAKESTELLEDTAELEGIKLEEDVVDSIIDLTEGSSREMMNYLQKIKSAETEEERQALLIKPKAKHDAIEICRLLMTGSPRRWKELASVLKDVDTEPEGIRALINAYFSKILLSGGPKAPRAYLIMDIFKENLFYGKKPALIRLCYEALMEVHSDHGEQEIEAKK